MVVLYIGTILRKGSSKVNFGISAVSFNIWWSSKMEPKFIRCFLHPLAQRFQLEVVNLFKLAKVFIFHFHSSLTGLRQLLIWQNLHRNVQMKEEQIGWRCWAHLNLGYLNCLVSVWRRSRELLRSSAAVYRTMGDTHSCMDVSWRRRRPTWKGASYQQFVSTSFSVGIQSVTVGVDQNNDWQVHQKLAPVSSPS